MSIHGSFGWLFFTFYASYTPKYYQNLLGSFERKILCNNKIISRIIWQTKVGLMYSILIKEMRLGPGLFSIAVTSRHWFEGVSGVFPEGDEGLILQRLQNTMKIYLKRWLILFEWWNKGCTLNHWLVKSFNCTVPRWNLSKKANQLRISYWAFFV